MPPLNGWNNTHGAPKNSFVVMTENAYLSNTKFDDEIVERLCIGIRDMPVIREHPNWWVELYVDGFSAHTETETAQ